MEGEVSMRSILQTCKPLDDIISGTFNPEIFTASLSQVMDYYQGRTSIIHSVYTDGLKFFREATYHTENLKLILTDVLGRLAGDDTVPAIHRLETAFGGGKTHILIALAHLGYKGQELCAAVEDIIPTSMLPMPGEVKVVGIAGDGLPVHKPKGPALLPYTLWGEIAFQVGGEPLYREVEADATSYAAPGKDYFDVVLGDRKVLIIMDELAQYAVRLQAARPDGAANLAAFLLALHGYARTHSGIAVVLTLASATDAFARETERLKNLVSKVKGQDIDEEEVIALTQRAEKDIRSVAARDATTIVPIQAAEISRILAKRLFEFIDPQAAEETAADYMKMYESHASALPTRASQVDFREIMVAHYPFHPTFIRFLTEKVSTIENFQGTRGVLRTLALVTRSIWHQRLKIPMIHTCHIPLTDSRMVDEILGRTAGSDLFPILNADVGGPDSGTLSLGRSYAQMADQKNPHPLGYPLYEYTWKTVFLHSLVGRSEGLDSKYFGVTEADAIFDIAFPDLTPPQITMALQKIEDIEEGPLYLRFQHGRYFASLEPSINKVLDQIRRALTTDQVEAELAAAARKVVTRQQQTFQVVHDVSLPEHLPDTDKKPVLGMVALDAEEVKAENFFLTVGPNRPRFNQNLVFLLVPQTVRESSETWGEDRTNRATEMLNRLEGLARTVLAMRRLEAKPENYGITSARLVETEFKAKLREREHGLITAMTQAYDTLWYPSASGYIAHREIKAGPGEGGAGVIEEVRQALIEEGELLTPEVAATSERLVALGKLFFENTETPSLANLRTNFAQQRHWPVLESPALFEQIIRAGVSRGTWCLFRLASGESVKPEEFYSRDTGDLPFALNLSVEGWCLITLPGANKRGWGPGAVDKEKVKEIIYRTVEQGEAVKVEEVKTRLQDHYGQVDNKTIDAEIKDLLKSGKIGSYQGTPEQTEKPPDLIFGRGVMVVNVDPGAILVPPATVAKRGWLDVTPQTFTLSGREGAQRLLPLLSRLGSLYAKGAKSTIRALDLVDLEIPPGARLRVTLENVTPEGMKQLDEFFDILGGLVQPGAATEADLEIDNPDESCLFIQELKKS